MLGQRYAYDFIRTDERRGTHVHPASSLRWVLIGGRTRDCYGWGEPVHAASSGEVVVAIDGLPEREWLHVLRESWIAVGTTVRFSRGRGSIDPKGLAGNHVIMRAGDVFALYAHLAPGTIAVAPGQGVSVGEVIGRVGHTGNSTAPHLHFQLMDSGDALHSRGVACAFDSYRVRRDGRWEPVHQGIPGRGERVCADS